MASINPVWMNPALMNPSIALNPGRTMSWTFWRNAMLNAASSRMKHPKWKEYTDASLWSEEDLQYVIARRDAPVKGIACCRYDSQRPAPQIDRIKIEGGVAVGMLDVLSNEIISIIIEDLDIYSLERFAQTCRLARYMIETNSSYKMMQQYLPRFKQILAHSSLDRWVTLGRLRAELEHPTCRVCGNNGTSLYLPTCERLCFNCLRNNFTYWLLNMTQASECFALEAEDLQKVPVLHTVEQHFVPDQFPLTQQITHDLVPIRMAMKAALIKYGTTEAALNAAEIIAPDRGRFPNAEEKQLGEHYRRFRLYKDIPAVGWMPYEPGLRIQRKLSEPLGFPMPVDEYFGWAHVEMPYVQSYTEGHVPRYFCKGCEWPFKYQLDLQPEHIYYYGFPEGTTSRQALSRLMSRIRNAFTWEELLEHTRTCLGAGMAMWDYAMRHDPNMTQ